MDYEFLIVGQGITGSILANELADISPKFKIINYENVSSSSRVAAGIMHPMALKRGTLSWRGKEFFEFSDKYYENFDRLNGSEFYKKYSLAFVGLSIYCMLLELILMISRILLLNL